MKHELGGRTTSMAVEVVRLPPDRLALIGPALALHQQLDARRRAGVLMSATDLLPTGDGRFVTTVTVTREYRPMRPVPAVGRREVIGTAAVVGGWMIAFAVGALLVVALIALLWHLRLYILGGAGLITGVLLLSGRLGLCPGVHCPGCPHR